MKKYEAPMVELTKFDVEDVITTSISVNDIIGDDAATAAAAADINAAIAEGNNANGLDGVFSW